MIPWASAALLQEAYASSDTHIVCDAFGSQPQPRFSMHITVLSCVEQHCVHSISPALLCTKDLSFWLRRSVPEPEAHSVCRSRTGSFGERPWMNQA